MQAKVVLEKITEENLEEMLGKKLENPSKTDLNLHEGTSRKGIKVVNIETLSGSSYVPLMNPPKEKASEVEKRNEETIDLTTSKNDSGVISELDRDESPPRNNSVDNLNISPWTSQQFTTNFDDSEGEIFITPVKQKKPKSKKSQKKKKKLSGSSSTSQCGERILYGFRVREIPMKESSSDEEFESETEMTRPLSSTIIRKVSKKRQEKILTDDDNEDEISQSDGEDYPPAVSPCKQKPLFKTVYADIERKY